MFILSCYTVNSFTQLSSDLILVYLHYGLFLCLVAVLCTTVHLLLYLFCYLWFIVESTSSYFNVKFDWNWLIDLTMNWYLTHIISSSSLLYILYVLCLNMKYIVLQTVCYSRVIPNFFLFQSNLRVSLGPLVLRGLRGLREDQVSWASKVQRGRKVTWATEES